MEIYDPKSKHLMVDCWMDMRAASIVANTGQLKNIIAKLLMKHQQMILNYTQWDYYPQGASGVFLIADSHCSFHTYPEHGYISFDVYTCKFDTDVQRLASDLREALGEFGEIVEWRVQEKIRGVREKDRLTDKIYDELYWMGGKFEDIGECKKCGVCNSRPFIFLYPGEFEYRKRRQLKPEFTKNEFKVENGDVLYKCPILKKKDIPKLCLDAPLVCKLSPIQIFKRPNSPAFVKLTDDPCTMSTCPKKTFEKEWVVSVVKLIVELYVNLRVGE